MVTNIKSVSISGIRVDADEIGVELSWEDDLGYFGSIDFRQNVTTGVIRADSEHTSKDFILSVLLALVSNLKLND